MSRVALPELKRYGYAGGFSTATLAAGGFLPAGPGPWVLMLASLAVYTGSLALNDWADREHDAQVDVGAVFVDQVSLVRLECYAGILLLGDMIAFVVAGACGRSERGGRRRRTLPAVVHDDPHAGRGAR